MQYEAIFEDEDGAWTFGFGSTPKADVIFQKPEGVEIYRKERKAPTQRPGRIDAPPSE